MKAVRGLLIGPFPPPIGGDTVLTKNLWESRYWRKHGIVLDRIDTSPRAGVRLPGERLSGRDLARGAAIFGRFLAKLGRTDFVLLWSNSRFILTVGLAVVAACAVSRRPVFVKSFGAFIAKRIRGAPALRRRAILAVLGKRAIMIPETRGLERELRELGFRDERVIFLPNFLPDAALGAPPAARRFTGKCLFVGQVKREKGVFDILEALAQSPGFGCDFYGPILERDREAFLAAVSKSNGAAYRGVLEPEKVRDVMLDHDLLLLPTFHRGEGYPAVILEAFAAGMPVVASRWLALPELVEDGVRGILVPTQSPEKIREALGRLSRDEALYESLCGNAHRFVQSFSEKRVVEDVLIARVKETVFRGPTR